MKKQNGWLTWKARLHHWMFPIVACQCHVCAEHRRDEIACRLALVEQLRSNNVEKEKCPKI